MEGGYQTAERLIGRATGPTGVDAQGMPLTGQSTMSIDALPSAEAAKQKGSVGGTKDAISSVVGGVARAVVGGATGGSESLKSSAKRATMPPIVTTTHGTPWGDNTHSYNLNGNISIADIPLLEQQQLFNRSKIVERQVHACGSGGFGEFVVEHDVSHLTKAKLFQPGEKTPIAARFSTVTYGREFPDSARNPRGLAFKFYTEDGNYDVLSVNFPVFFCRDPSLGPSVIRSQARNPQSFQVNLDGTFDFMSLVPESTLANLWYWSDFGHPVGWRHMDGFPVHTFKWVNASGKPTYVRYNFKSKQGLKNWSFDEAVQTCGIDPDFAKRDLFNLIEQGGNAQWKLYIQTLEMDQVDGVGFNPFDATKEWPEEQFPLQPVGTLTVDRNPENYHRDIEQLAFSPGRLVPGIEPSPDLLLQFRLFFYQDTQFYRLGPNYHQIPVNCPFRAKQYHPLTRDGVTRVDANGGHEAAYYPNSFNVPPHPVPDHSASMTPHPVSGGSQKQCPMEFARTKTVLSDEGTDREYVQAREFYKKLGDVGQQHLHYNIARGYAVVSRAEIKIRFLMQCYQAGGERFVNGVLAECEKLKCSDPAVTLDAVVRNVKKYTHTSDQAKGYLPYPLI